jgi:NitT/TauT family transport system permease protein
LIEPLDVAARRGWRGRRRPPPSGPARDAGGGLPSRLARRLAPFATIAVLLAAWEAAVRWKPGSLLPGPWAVTRAILEMAANGLLWKHLAASLFRVSWGYLWAVAWALPAGLWLGSVRRAEQALGPWLEVLRPISPLAWIPIAILWLGVGDLAAIAIIFFASFLSLTFVVKDVVRRIPQVHLQAGSNFGLDPRTQVRKVILPAILPQLIVGLRLSLGIAWLVVVAAEMIAVNSGLGFLIIDARNAGNRYDLVVAGMALIGLVGLALDGGVRRLERLPALRWGYTEAGT